MLTQCFAFRRSDGALCVQAQIGEQMHIMIAEMRGALGGGCFSRAMFRLPGCAVLDALIKRSWWEVANQCSVIGRCDSAVLVEASEHPAQGE